MIQRVHLDCVDSTNLEARRRVDRGAIATVAWITAREQTAGRGTRERRWASPRDAGLYATFVRVEGGGRPVTAVYTRAAGVACVEAIADAAGVAVGLKSVNDLCAGGGKVGGILTESIVEEGVMRALFVGVGINVFPAIRRVELGSLPPIALQELRPDAGDAIDLPALESVVLERLAAWVRRAEEPGGPEYVQRAWERHAVAGVFPGP